MKPRFLFACSGILLMLTILSCKKESKIAEKVNPGKKPVIEVENGTLHFPDYDAFFQTMLRVNAMTPEQRTTWEKETGFKSLRTVYNEFNKKLEAIELSHDSSGWNAVKNDYAKQIVWNNEGTSYDINCSGIIESGVVNADGLVMVKDELLSFSKKEIVATKMNNGANNKVNERAANTRQVIWSSAQKNGVQSKLGTFDPFDAVGTKANPGSFTVGNGPVKTVRSGRQEGNAQLRIFNINNSSGNRAFCTIRYWAQHLTGIGVWRNATTLAAGIDGVMRVYQANVDQGYSIPVSDNGNNSPNWDIRGSNCEVVVVASTYLKDNNSDVSTGYNHQFAAVSHTLDDYDAVNGHWSAFSPWIPFSGTQNVIRIHFSSLGTGLTPPVYAHSFLIAP